jgi:hypothetical protein
VLHILGIILVIALIVYYQSWWSSSITSSSWRRIAHPQSIRPETGRSDEA